MTNRVVVYTPEPSSGAARYVFELVKSLAGTGASVLLFCPSNFTYATELANGGIPLSFSAMRGTEPGSLLNRITRNLRFFALHFVRQLALCRRHDVFHVQFPLYFPLGLISFLVAKCRGSKVVFTAHDPIPHKWLLPKSLRFLERGTLSFAYHLSDRIIVHNDADRKLLAGEFGQPPSKISVIPHGPLTMGEQAHAFEEGERLELLLFGSIREDKGVHLAVEAVQHLSAQGRKVRLTIAGAVANAREQEYWEGCKNLIGQGSDCIRVEERFIADAEMPSLIAGCHAMILPYLGGNSESGVAALALANERAIIARNVGGLGTLLSAADLGIAIEHPTTLGVEEAIELALALGLEDLREKGARGAKLMNSTRSWKEIGRKTVDLYASIRSRQTT